MAGCLDGEHEAYSLEPMEMTPERRVIVLEAEVARLRDDRDAWRRTSRANLEQIAGLKEQVAELEGTQQ